MCPGDKCRVNKYTIQQVQVQVQVHLLFQLQSFFKILQKFHMLVNLVFFQRSALFALQLWFNYVLFTFSFL